MNREPAQVGFRDANGWGRGRIVNSGIVNSKIVHSRIVQYWNNSKIVSEP